MIIHYVSRTDYKEKLDSGLIKSIIEQYPELEYIPEGGENELAKKGCSEILDEISIKQDFVCVPCGTGTTLAGILNSKNLDCAVLGFPVLKGAETSILQNINSTAEEPTRIGKLTLISDYHFGGYAKYNLELIQFMKKFQSNTQILLDQVYTGKMMYGILDKIKSGYFPKGSVILAIHTGGLQGRLPELNL